ncbi:hypothetical protein COB21_04960 [Candidatus Aerophobetes bacterium]|uniref:HAD-IB family hydrolase n=1 Tax=Aerophobetes bacterium TaxID=2030807 RepID=A0A2A4X059_UNCAE|nr:MAG: hypothetical protein COB21_04960 [Candidatus Aerophobetes bacterium]
MSESLCRVSAFDLDHTLIKKNTSALFYYYMIKKGVFHPTAVVRSLAYSFRHRFFNLGIKQVHEQVFEKFLKGMSLAFLNEHVQAFLKEDFFKYIYYPAFKELRQAQYGGHYTVILSASPSFLVGAIAEYFGVFHWSSSEYRLDEEGRLSCIDSVLLGDEKADYIHKLVKKLNTDVSLVTAYSDSIVDLPFLLSAGKGVVVNPKKTMRQMSQKYKFEVI